MIISDTPLLSQVVQEMVFQGFKEEDSQIFLKISLVSFPEVEAEHVGKVLIIEVQI
jgi:hypothetical protein